ncbi:PP2C family protein-serine/threonine phosphatase [Methanobrevibacter sp.]|uniref:PP2C family protein-serine/threonine phosphatase n=1 Tax=Methanobrevibacter sp. TaxID=66852 RepID=UPI00388F0C23
MKSKIKRTTISFIIMLIFYFAITSTHLWRLGLYTPHVGLLFVLGLLFGPYGALGAVSANVIINYIQGYTPIEILPSAIFSFGVSCLTYKLWYSGFRNQKITKPRLDNTYHLTLFFSSIIICGLVYSIVHGNLSYLFFVEDLTEYSVGAYFLNFINVSFIMGILGIWIFKKSDLIETPKTSEKPVNRKLYRILLNLLVIVSIISFISLILDVDESIVIGEAILIGILLFGYLTKPFEYKIEPSDSDTVIEKIIRIFLIITLIISILGITFSYLSYNIINVDLFINLNMFILTGIIVTDMIITLFFIPGIILLGYIENRVIKPISSFSEIEGFIKENEKIESAGLVNIYSKYVNEKNEIGTLARSYTELINHNNNYIENIQEIEGEKERIKAELDIATKIQASNLPTEAIINENYKINGFSRPAREVGGDFFDYYELDDDNLAIVIGDASGKGVPAALLTMITQVMIKQILKHNKNPSKALYSLNNQLCENNAETMFITLWLGIYNNTTKKLTFSNAGHNPPLIKENDEFRYLDIESGIALGILEDFEYESEEMTLADELVLYTDGITDAHNANEDMYGEERLLNFFNEFESDDSPITPLLKDIDNFTENQEQFDDMTLVYLWIK